MSRLLGFLQDDLKEIAESLELIHHIHYEDSENIEKHIERLEEFISYWQQHSNKLGEKDWWKYL